MDNIALKVSIAAFGLSLVQFIRNTTRQKKEATLVAYNELQKEAFSKLNRFQNDLSEIKFESREWEEITDCLVKIENFSTGINTGIYSLTILNRLGGGYFIRTYDRLQTIIEKKRADNISVGKHYNEFEKTVNRLKRKREGIIGYRNTIREIGMMEYGRLCDEVRKCSRRSSGDCKQSNGVICARRILRKHVGGEKEKLLQLKAQSKYLDFNQMSASLMTIGALLVAVFSIYISVAMGGTIEQERNDLVIQLLLMMVPIILLIISWHIRNRTFSIWNEYFNVAIEELEIEFEDKK